MKKVLMLILTLGLLFTPFKTEAKSYNFSGYYCDSKKDLGDGTFYMTCHILATTDFEVNHIEGTLILKNVTLKDVKTNGDWVNNNGLSSNVSFTSSSTHQGSFAVADLVFVGNNSDTECEASFMPKLAEKQTENKVCAIVENEYYGKNGTKVTEEKYYEECHNYVCQVVNNKYYFNSKGQSVSYEKYQEDCASQPLPEPPKTGLNSGYLFLPFGIAAIIVINKVAKKNKKIYKL